MLGPNSRSTERRNSLAETAESQKEEGPQKDLY